jgi:hypothetical protein
MIVAFMNMPKDVDLVIHTVIAPTTTLGYLLLPHATRVIRSDLQFSGALHCVSCLTHSNLMAPHTTDWDPHELGKMIQD